MDELNLEEMSKNLNSKLNNETSESLKQWINEKRENVYPFDKGKEAMEIVQSQMKRMKWIHQESTYENSVWMLTNQSNAQSIDIRTFYFLIYNFETEIYTLEYVITHGDDMNISHSMRIHMLTFSLDEDISKIEDEIINHQQSFIISLIEGYLK